MIIRSAAFAAAGGFDETLKYCEDWHCWCRLAALGEFRFLPDLLLDYRVHEANTMNAALRSPQDFLPAAERVFGDRAILDKLPAHLVPMLRRAAEVHLITYAAPRPSAFADTARRPGTRSWRRGALRWRCLAWRCGWGWRFLEYEPRAGEAARRSKAVTDVAAPPKSGNDHARTSKCPVVAAAPAVLDGGTGIRREPLRPPAFRIDGFEQQFDAETLFYDAFFAPTGTHVVTVGPPPLNLRPLIDRMRVVALPSGVSCGFRVEEMDRTARLWIAVPRGTDRLVGVERARRIRDRAAEEPLRPFRRPACAVHAFEEQPAGVDRGLDPLPSRHSRRRCGADLRQCLDRICPGHARRSARRGAGNRGRLRRRLAFQIRSAGPGCAAVLGFGFLPERRPGACAVVLSRRGAQCDERRHRRARGVARRTQRVRGRRARAVRGGALPRRLGAGHRGNDPHPDGSAAAQAP